MYSMTFINNARLPFKTINERSENSIGTFIPDKRDDHSLLTSVCGLWPCEAQNTTSRRVQEQKQEALVAIVLARNGTPVE